MLYLKINDEPLQDYCYTKKYSFEFRDCFTFKTDSFSVEIIKHQGTLSLQCQFFIDSSNLIERNNNRLCEKGKVHSIKYKDENTLEIECLFFWLLMVWEKSNVIYGSWEVSQNMIHYVARPLSCFCILYDYDYNFVFQKMNKMCRFI